MDAMNHITGLDAARYEKARRLAEEQVRASVLKPEETHYAPSTFSEHPRSVTRAAWSALIVLGLAAFWISAGKQIAATDLLLAPMIGAYGNRLSAGWLDAALVFGLTLGELGTILFSMSGALLGAKGWKAAAFWSVAFLCASIALVANVSITSLHPENIAGMPFYGWLLTVAPPVIVLFIGLFAEQLLLKSLEARAKAKRAYETALEVWRKAQESPAEHPDYSRKLALAIYDQLYRVSPANRQKIDALVQADGGWRIELVKREIARHEWATFAAFAPFGEDEKVERTRIDKPHRPALPNGVSVGGIGANGGNEGSTNEPNEPNDERTANGQPSGKLADALAWLANNPDAAALTVSEVQRMMEADGLKLGRETVWRALKQNASG